MTRTEQVNLRLTETEAQRVREAAARLGLTVAEYVRQCVEEREARACPTCRGTGRIA